MICQNIYSASDDVYYTRGKHGLKFGFLGNRFDQAERLVASDRGRFFIPAMPTFCNPYLEPSRIHSATKTAIISTIHLDFMYRCWRATSRLTFNVGVRYEFNTTPRELNGKEWSVRNHAMDPAPTHGPIMQDHSYWNFSPRLGFAWDIFGDGKTALRGSAGILYDVGNFHNLFVLNAGGSPPLVTSVSSTTSNTVIGFPYPFTSAGYGHAITDAVDYNVSQPHLFQLNLSLERQLPKHTALSLAYVHTRGAHLWNTAEANSAYPTYVSPSGVQYWSDSLVACENAVPFLPAKSKLHEHSAYLHWRSILV